MFIAYCMYVLFHGIKKKHISFREPITEILTCTYRRIYDIDLSTIFQQKGL